MYLDINFFNKKDQKITKIITTISIRKACFTFPVKIILCIVPARNIQSNKSGNTPSIVPTMYFKKLMSESAAVTLIKVYPMGIILKIIIVTMPSSVIILFNFWIFFLERRYFFAFEPRNLITKKVNVALKKHPVMESINPFFIPTKRVVAVITPVMGNMVMPAIIKASRIAGYRY